MHKGDDVIEGLLLTPLPVISNPKGNIYHALKVSAPGYQGFGEAYFSTVIHGVTKGWKRHKRYTLNLVVPVGDIRFVVYDDRLGSSTCGQFFETCLGIDSNYARLTVPPGLWLAFQGLGKFNLLLNVIAAEHDPSEAENKDLCEIFCPALSDVRSL
jgi:dTDP-4-dehydrorhamnose 3,5-epimerase